MEKVEEIRHMAVESHFPRPRPPDQFFSPDDQPCELLYPKVDDKLTCKQGIGHHYD